MDIPYLDLTIQQKAIEPQIMDLMQKVLRGGQYILGPEVTLCEEKLAEFVGAPYCLTAASGTDALLMGLLARDIKPGDEIIIPAFSFFATAEVIALIGAVPVFVDIEPDTFNMDVSQIEAKITNKTKGIMTVSLYGQVADMKEVNAIASKHGLFVMEDAAQSFGATYEGKKSCNLSSLAATSFFPAKPLGCYGDGGAIFCDTEAEWVRLKEIRVHGQESRYHHTRLGYNGRLDTMQCAVLLVKLERYPWEVEQRQRIANTYSEEFKNIEGLVTPVTREGRDSVFAQYTIKAKDRDSLQKTLMENGVPTSVHYPKGMHQQPAMEQYAPKESLNVTESVCEQVLSLPLYADMPEAHLEYVVSTVKKVLS